MNWELRNQVFNDILDKDLMLGGIIMPLFRKKPEKEDYSHAVKNPEAGLKEVGGELENISRQVKAGMKNMESCREITQEAMGMAGGSTRIPLVSRAPEEFLGISPKLLKNDGHLIKFRVR